MITLFSSKDIDTVVKNIIWRQDWEGLWTDKDNKAVSFDDICKKFGYNKEFCTPLEWIKLGMQMLANELQEVYPAEGTEIDYYSDDTPRLTK